MYTQFFRLTQTPFSIAPDPRYLFMSGRHREALAHLLYGVNNGGGVVVLTGEIGAGKTTVCRCLLEQVPANCDVAYIFNPKLTALELLQSVCDEFRIALRPKGAASVKDYVDALNWHLLNAHADGRNNVLIIDEAQNLSPDVLEQLRLLTNLETNERKLLQIILIGQPELRAMLDRPELEQLAQRVIARYHLQPLSQDETARYIRHRLAVAGLKVAPPFPSSLMKRIHRITHGVPRRINLLCDRAMLGAYAEDKPEVNRRIVDKAAAEVFGKPAHTASGKAQRWRHVALGMVAGAAAAGAAAWAISSGNLLGRVVAHDARPHVVAAVSGKAGAPSAAGVGKPAPVASSMPPAIPAPANDADASAADLRERNDALRRLAQLWNVSLQGALPCLDARKEKLHCYIDRDLSIAELRQLDRPAVLTMQDDAGKTYYALLTNLSSTGATLQTGDRHKTVGMRELAYSFQGGYATFWRAPYGDRELVGPGYRGMEADWVAAQLAKLDGAAQPPADRPVDHDTVRRIRDFQLAQGIRADGIVGPRTFMHLNRVAGIKEPRLRGKPGTTALAGE